MFGDYALDGVGAQLAVPAAWKERLVWLAVAFALSRRREPSRLGGQWRGSLPSAFAGGAHVGAAWSSTSAQRSPVSSETCRPVWTASNDMLDRVRQVPILRSCRSPDSRSIFTAARGQTALIPHGGPRRGPTQSRRWGRRASSLRRCLRSRRPVLTGAEHHDDTGTAALASALRGLPGLGWLVGVVADPVRAIIGQRKCHVGVHAAGHHGRCVLPQLPQDHRSLQCQSQGYIPPIDWWATFPGRVRACECSPTSPGLPRLPWTYRGWTS